MARLLQVGVVLSNVGLGICLVLMVAGLGMVARPEAFAGIGLHEAGKTGLEVALAGGFGAIVSAIVGRVLDLLQDGLDGEA